MGAVVQAAVTAVAAAIPDVSVVRKSHLTVFLDPPFSIARFRAIASRIPAVLSYKDARNLPRVGLVDILGNIGPAIERRRVGVVALRA